MTMKRDGNRLAWLGGLAVCAGLCTLPAVTSGMGYDRITERNVFALKPPPPPVDPNAVKEEAPSKITLTGITTILGNKRALLRVAVAAGKEENYMLTEGQRDGSVEVLEIDEKAGSVKVSNAGQVATLTFDKNGAKAAPSAIVAPGNIPVPMATGNVGSMPIGGNTNPNLVPRTIPTRLPRTPQQPPVNSGTQGLADNPMGYSGGPPAQANTTSYSHLTGEEQTIMIEVERERNKEAVSKGIMPPPPFTALTPPPQAPQ